MHSSQEEQTLLNKIYPFRQVGEPSLDVEVYIKESLFKRLELLATRDPASQVAWLLLGQVIERESGTMVTIVEEAIDLEITAQPQQRFSGSVWQRANRNAQVHYASQTVLGWFLSDVGEEGMVSSGDLQLFTQLFPEPWQLLFWIDPREKRESFFLHRDGQFQELSGYRVYDCQVQAKPAPSGAHPAVQSVSADEKSQDNHVSRTVDKIWLYLQEPHWNFKDIVQISLLGTMCLLLLINLARQDGVVEIDQSNVLAGQQELQNQLEDLKGEVTDLEKHLAALALIESQLDSSLEGRESLADTDLTEEEGTQEVASEPRQGVPDGTRVELYRVRSGDTLTNIAQSQYQESSSHLVEALGEFNRLEPPNYDLYEGQELKLPSKEALLR